MKKLLYPRPTCQHCRLCQNFIPEGRRGGTCQKLGAPVRGSWKACSLAIPAFAPSWEVIEDVGVWPRPAVSQSDLTSLDCYAFKNSPINPPVRKIVCQSGKLATDKVMV